MGQAGTILLFGLKWAAAASFGLCESVMALAGTAALLASGVTLILLTVHDHDLDSAAMSLAGGASACGRRRSEEERPV